MEERGEEVNRVYLNPIRPDLTRIGWIGAGSMGAAMAGRILAAGYSLTIHARTPAKAEHLRRLGARIAASPTDAAASSDVLFAMVSRPSDVREAILAGALPSLPPGAVVVDCTSSLPSLAREISAAARAMGCWAVDAPVSGGDAGAREGRLAILAGGDERVVQWLAPLFARLGTVTWMGEAGSGQSAKIANQIAVAAGVVGLTEAVVFAAKAGLDKRRFLEGIREGEAASGVVELWGERVIKRDFEPGGMVEHIVKDLGMALDGGGEAAAEAEEVVVMPGAALCRELFMGMVANGEGKMGIQGFVTSIERMNGISNGEYEH